MSLLPFGDFPPHRPRAFVPTDAKLNNWSVIEPLFNQLESALAAVTTTAQLERWIINQGEVEAALDEESSRRYIAMTCHTDNEEAEKAYLDFVENIEPKIKPRQFALAQQFLKHPLREELPADRYGVFDRDTALHVELFREENIPLETEEAKVGQQYQKLSGGLTVEFRGEEKTLIQMGRYLEEPDRATRQEAWETVAARRLKEREQFDAQMNELMKLRGRIAANAGFDNYRDYAFKARGRFDYGSEECFAFHDAIEQEIVPLLREIQGERKRALGLDQLRPWDLSVDPQNRPPLKPFEAVDDLESKTHRIFQQVNPALGADFALMRDFRLLDLANRKGKAPGGYQCSLAESRLPFIFMNAVGLQRDVETLLHEGGHAFHALATREEDVHSYRHAPIEFCEVASMSMELLGGEFIDNFYEPDDARRARIKHLQGVVDVFPWIASVDAFQHWLYTHPGHSVEERGDAWLNIMNRFGGMVDWSGHEDARRNLWHKQLHIFLYPFYYVEYGIAQLGALQVWANYRKDPAAALDAYREALALGGSKPLPELFAAAGCTFQFDAATVKPLVQLIRDELTALKEA